MGCSEDRHNLTIQEGPGLLEAENQSWPAGVEWLLALSGGGCPALDSAARLSLRTITVGFKNPRGYGHNLFRDPAFPMKGLTL